ncbi:MAG: cytochrome c3 family protein [Nitrospira sp.]|nr:hypothetical protein [Nitrospira sp.]
MFVCHLRDQSFLFTALLFACFFPTSTFADSLESALMPGQVIQGHAKWEETCAKCHKRFDKAAQTQLCQDCHKDLRQDIESKQRFHGRLKEQRECRECHTDHKGREENIAPINESTFDHAQTNFALTGGHADTKKAECKACHKPKIKYREAPSECLACHKKDDTHKSNFGEKCEGCHTATNWKEIIFDHERDTKYPLRDKHRSAKCESCHTGHLYKDKLKTDCYSCHKKDDYHKGIFGQKCETCHGEKDWKTSPFNHDKDTKYPLLGKHKTTKCESCHKVPVAKEKTPTGCYACHKKDDKHEDALGRACESCHTEKDWKETPAFDHGKTLFPLRGKHIDTKCKDCHPDQRYKPTPVDCYSCHKKDDYHKGIFSQKCETCHGEKDWKTSPFNHDKDTKYPLLGKHKTTKCESCHTVPVAKAKTPTACYACHKKDDKHENALGQACEQCHTEKEWKDTRLFEHNKTKFPLLGKHEKVDCKGCHPDRKYRPTPLTCHACHKKDDVHKGDYGEKCQTCHTDRTWKEITFDHDRDTKFALREKHRSVTCRGCHAGHLYQDKLKTDCGSCHRKDDIHNAVFGVKCETCHSEKMWKPSPFNHDRDTKYLLLGAHELVTCEECHRVPVAKEKTPTTCQACHRKEDKHKGTFGDRCETCHREKSWKLIRFDHDRDTKYPLNGKHRTTTCTSCHKGLLYKDKTPTDCVACHKKDDKHKGSFGSVCGDCHNEQKWQNILFDHDRQTKYSLRGKHVGLKCDSCHKGHVYKDKTSPECYACHKKDDKHKGQEGQQCETCHREASWKAVSFDHDKARFPLRGQHDILDCRKCHKSLLFKDAPLDCVGCHAKEDVHKQRFGTQCETCHTARDWKLWDFDHDVRTKFKLDGGHKKVDCYDCHHKPMKGKLVTSNTCSSCHKNDDKHEGGFGPQCDQCHTTSLWKTIKPGGGIRRK